MIAVFKREFSSAFHRLYGFITVGVTALLSAVIFALYNLTYAYETTNAVFSAMSVVAALVIPVTAVSMFPSRKRADTDSVYDMMPLTSRDVVLGKYMAALAITLLPTLLMALYPVVANIFGNVDMAQSYAALLAYVLFEAALLAVCMLIAASAKSHLRGYIYCYVTVVVWYLAGILKVLVPLKPIASLIAFVIVAAAIAPVLWLVTRRIVFSVAVSLVAEAITVVCYALSPASFAGLFESFIDKLSVFRHFDVFVYGVFDLEGILFFLLVTALFLFLTLRRYERRTVRKKREGLRITGVTSAMLAVIIVATTAAVNFAVAAAPDTAVSFDATSTDKISVNAETKKFLGAVDKDVTIYVLEPTGEADYLLYLDRIASCNDRIDLEKVYNVSTPEFYTEREIDISTISANSLVVQCGDRWEYLSYTDLFTYYVNSQTLGTMELSASEYSYYYQMFIQSEDYIDYLYSLIYETTLKFCGDKMICTYVEYVTADIIPAMYYMTGHGVKDISDTSNPYSVLGLSTLDISTGEIPADAAGILINMPTEDITSAEKDAILSYLERGGQITLITDTSALELPNLCAVLAAYGMSADKEHVSVKIELESEESDESEEDSESVSTGTTTEFTPELDYDNDILYYLDGTALRITVDKANAIKRDATVKEKLVHYPLLLTPADESGESDGEGSDQSVIACAAETTDNGAHLVWFTAGGSFNSTSSQGYAPVVYAMSWVTLEFTSEVGDIPSVIYQQPSAPIESGTAIFTVTLIALPMILMVFGAIVFYRRKKAK
ncbi:MAG: hypothetical protein IJY08_00655 [Clostridia bacterium]|nr:hypothetical protein [Clostridia bacterium]